jgi:hypothetical protein
MAQSAEMRKPQHHLRWALCGVMLAFGSFGCAPQAAPEASASSSLSEIAYSPEPPQPSPIPSPSALTPEPSITPEPSVQAGLEASLRFRCRGGYVDVYATIKNNSPYASGLVYFNVKAWVRTWVQLGKNTTKWYWNEDWVQSWLNLWATVEGRSIPPGSKATYLFTTLGKYPEQRGSPLVAILVSAQDVTDTFQYDSPC